MNSLIKSGCQMFSPSVSSFGLQTWEALFACQFLCIFNCSAFICLKGKRHIHARLAPYTSPVKDLHGLPGGKLKYSVCSEVSRKRLAYMFFFFCVLASTWNWSTEWLIQTGKAYQQKSYHKNVFYQHGCNCIFELLQCWLKKKQWSSFTHFLFPCHLMLIPTWAFFYVCWYRQGVSTMTCFHSLQQEYLGSSS